MKTTINNLNTVKSAHYDIPLGVSGCITGVGLGYLHNSSTASWNSEPGRDGSFEL